MGELRWREPQDPESWEGVLTARDDPRPCTQPEIDEAFNPLPSAIGGEDCLYLNVYRPPSDAAGLPVYFWIHGGGNVAGSADLYDLEHLAIEGNLVAVVVQYRMNVFGYFTHPSLRRGDSAAASGNFGTLDQIKALQWVRDNIAAFGGDPGNVTIAGESAGGHNVTALIMSPLANGLFHRAVMQSGGMASQSVATTDEIANLTIDKALVMKGLATDVARAQVVRRNMGVAELAGFLYGLTAAELLQAHARGPGMEGIPMANVIEDGFVIPGDLLCTVERGAYAQVPVMAGVTATETGIVGPIVYAGLSDVIKAAKDVDEVLPAAGTRGEWSKNREYGSALWRAVMLDELVRRAAAHQRDLYVYSFDWGMNDVLSEPLELIYGAAHTMEIPFFHGNVDADGLRHWLVFASFTDASRPGRKALSEAMVSYLAQFARTGNPNAPGSRLPRWQPWAKTPGVPKTLHLDADLAAARIRMDSDELWVAEVRRALDSEPPEVQSHVRSFLAAHQSYAIYEPGDYQYGSCQ